MRQSYLVGKTRRTLSFGDAVERVEISWFLLNLSEISGFPLSSDSPNLIDQYNDRHLLKTIFGGRGKRQIWLIIKVPSGC